MTKVPFRTVSITKEILDSAVPENSGHCAIAQALRHMGASSTRVTADTVVFNMDNKRYTYPLPAKAAVELIKFDEGKPVKPFKFILQGNCGTVMDVEERGPYKKLKGVTKKAKSSRGKRGKSKNPRFCVRRFHGIRVIHVPAEAE